MPPRLQGLTSFLTYVPDITVPRLQCPPAVTYEYFNSTGVQVEARWPDVSVTDNVGVARIQFDPPNGTAILIHRITTVTVTAWDAAGNKATCSFLYQAERKWDSFFPKRTNKLESCSLYGFVGIVSFLACVLFVFIV